MTTIKVLLCLSLILLVAEGRRHHHREHHHENVKQVGKYKTSASGNGNGELQSGAQEVVINSQKDEDISPSETEKSGCEKLKCHGARVCVIHNGHAKCMHEKHIKRRRKLGAGSKKKRPEHAIKKSKKSNLLKSQVMKKPSDEHSLKTAEQENGISKHSHHKHKKAHHLKTKKQRKQRKNSKKTSDKKCTDLELNGIGRRLLDWFKLLQDESTHTPQEHHSLSKRHSKKKELIEDDECLCQAPVSWEFQQLDMDFDGHLSQKELRQIENNMYESCVRPFLHRCETDGDHVLSEKEWCCCFASILPPCLAAQRRVPTTMLLGAPKPLPGAYQPNCDTDGFFEPIQCHGSIGYCWCVDRNGQELENTRQRGRPQCEKARKAYRVKKS